MKIKMLQSCRGSDVDKNGVSMGSKLYPKDREFEVLSNGTQPGKDQMGESLATSFVTSKVAEVSEAASPDESQESPKEGAPENKMEPKAPSNKKRGGRSRH